MSTAHRVKIAACILALAGVGIDLEHQCKTSQIAAMADLPVAIRFRHAFFGSSMVGKLGSHSPKDMAVVVDVVEAATHGHRSYLVRDGHNLLGRADSRGRAQR